MFKKNLAYTFIFSLLSTLSTFIVIKFLFVYFNYDKPSYGLWMIVFSTLSYIFLMDLGLSNGLRNIITPLITKQNNLYKEYIYNNYMLMLLITIPLFIVTNIIIEMMSFNFMYSVKGFDMDLDYFKSFIRVIVNLQILYFLLTCNKPLFHALSKSYLINLAQLLSNILIIILIYISISCNIFANWIELAYIYIGSQIITLFLISLYITNKNKIYFKLKFDPKKMRILFNVGFKFLLLQISNLILFNSIPLLIGLVIGLSDSLQYQLSYKLLSAFLLVFSIIMSPIWTMILKESSDGNIEKIKRTFNYLFLLFMIISVIILMFGFVQNYIITVWMGKNFNLTLVFSLMMCLYIILNILCSVMQGILNGLNLFRPQIIGYIGGSIFLLISSLVINYFPNKNLEIFLTFAVVSLIIPNMLMVLSYFKFIKRKLN